MKRLPVFALRFSEGEVEQNTVRPSVCPVNSDFARLLRLTGCVKKNSFHNRLCLAKMPGALCSRSALYSKANGPCWCCWRSVWPG